MVNEMSDPYREPIESEEIKIPFNWTKVCFFAALFATLMCAGWCGTRIFLNSRFGNQCEYYITSARHEVSPLATIADLDAAIAYVEANDMTHGHTTIFPTKKDPDESLKHWYIQLMHVRDRLASMSEVDPSTAMEPVAATLVYENYLSRLQRGIPGPPEGISLHGFNTLFFYWLLISVIGGAVLWIVYGTMKPDCRFW